MTVLPISRSGDLPELEIPLLPLLILSNILVCVFTALIEMDC